MIDEYEPNMNQPEIDKIINNFRTVHVHRQIKRADTGVPNPSPEKKGGGEKGGGRERHTYKQTDKGGEQIKNNK